MFGKFLAKDTKYFDNLIDLAQEQNILDIIDVGKSGTNTIVSVVLTIDKDSGKSYLTGVTRNMYDMLDFTENKQLTAYKHMSKQVVKKLGAYSNKFNLNVFE